MRHSPASSWDVLGTTDLSKPGMVPNVSLQKRTCSLNFTGVDEATYLGMNRSEANTALTSNNREMSYV